MRDIFVLSSLSRTTTSDCQPDLFVMENNDFEDLFGDDMLLDDEEMESLNDAPEPVETHVDSTYIDDEMECSYVPPSYALQENDHTDGVSDDGDHKPPDSALVTLSSPHFPAPKRTVR